MQIVGFLLRRLKLHENPISPKKVSQNYLYKVHVLFHILLLICSETYQGRLVGGYHENHTYNTSLDKRKQVFRVSDQVRHKLACTVTEEGLKLEIVDLIRGGIVLSV